MRTARSLPCGLGGVSVQGAGLLGGGLPDRDLTRAENPLDTDPMDRLYLHDI